MNKFINQMNSNKSNEKYDLIEIFFKINSDSMSDYFTKMMNVWKADTKNNYFYIISKFFKVFNRLSSALFLNLSQKQKFPNSN